MAELKLKYINDPEEDKERVFEVRRLGYRKIMRILNEHIPFKTWVKKGNEYEPPEPTPDVMIKIMEDCLKTIKNLDLDELNITDVKDIFEKYFVKDIKISMGGGGDPKLKES